MLLFCLTSLHPSPGEFLLATTMIVWITVVVFVVISVHPAPVVTGIGAVMYYKRPKLAIPSKPSV